MARGLRVISHVTGRGVALGWRVDSDARELALRQLGHCKNIQPNR
jgi:hypothetical protein